MPDVTLRAYLDELDGLLAREAYDPVMMHCHHILQHFPKNLDTYRLLGSALLRSRNHKDAAEVFERLLSAEPADFQAHYGLSEVYEIDKDLTAAIWHMERAFDAAPQNTQVADQLKRLYEKRDGTRPDKIQMTRAALARQFINAQLYDQAVAELVAAVENSPERYDLQVLLAEAFFKAHYLKDAGEIALDILDKLPDCLPAHILMVQLWLSMKRPDDAKPFLTHVEDLAPYTSLELITESGIAPDAAFTIAKLDYEAAAAAKLSTTMPDWMNDFPLETPNNFSATGSSRGNKPKVATINEEVPSWLGDLNDPTMPAAPAAPTAPDWFPAGVSFDSAPAATPAAPAESVEDWFKDMAAATPAVDETTPDWFKDIPVAEEAKPRSAPTGLTGFLNDMRSEEGAPADGLNIPQPDMDWMSEVGSPTAVPVDDELAFLNDDFELPAMESITGDTPADDEMPDFLLELEDDVPAPRPSLSELFKEGEVDDSPIVERPMSLTGIFGGEPEPISEVDDSPIEERRPSLTQLFGSPGELIGPDEPVVTDTAPSVNPRSTSEMAAMLAFFDDQEQTGDAPPSAGLGWLPATPEVEPAESVNLSWLQTPSEEVQTEETDAELPAWLAPAQDMSDDDALALPTTGELNADWMGSAQPAEASPGDDFDNLFGAELGVEEVQEQETPSWLTDTPASQVETPVTTSEDDTPDWLVSGENESDWMGSAQPAETSTSDDFDNLFGAELGVEEVQEQETPSWLTDTPATQVETPVTTSEDDAPDWLLSDESESDWMGSAQPAEASASDDFDNLFGAELGVEAIQEQDTPDWLSNAPAAQVETTVTTSEDDAPDWLLSDESESDWLSGTTEDAQPAAAELPDWMSGAATVDSAETTDTPDWLTSDESESNWLSGTTADAQPAAAELPDWMSGAATVDSVETTDTPDWLSSDESESDWLSGTTTDAQPAAAELPDWMSGAATVESAETTDTPDWLTSDESESNWLSGTTEEAQPAAAELPDWMSGAATVESTETTDTPDWLTSDEGESDWLSGTTEDAQPTAAELPDWMSGAATVESAEATDTPDWLTSDEGEADWLSGTTEDAQPAAAELPDWMSGAATVDSAETTDTPDWLTSDEGEADWLSGTTEQAQPAAAELPDWMSGAASVETTDTPDWLSSDESESDWLSGTTEDAQPAAAELPDWMSGAATVDSAETTDTPDWLSSDEGESDWLSGTTAESQPAAAELPDWMSGAATVESAETTDTPDWLSSDEGESDWLSGTTADVQPTAAELPDWMSGAATVESAEATDTPDWLTSDESESDWLSGTTEDAQPAAAELPDWMSGAATVDSAETTDTPDWLSSDESESDWLSGTTEQTQPAAAELPDWMSSAATLDSAPTTDTPDWLAADEGESDWLSGATTDAQPAAAELPDWMSGAATDDSAETTDTPDWLSSDESESDWLSGTTADAQPAAAELPDWMSGAATVETAETTDTPDWLSSDEGESDWLSGTTEDAQPAAAELPDWMSGAATVESAETTDTPDWLSSDESESDWLSEGAAAPASQDDWLTGIGQPAAQTADWLEASPEDELLAATDQDTPDWLRGAAQVEEREPTAPQDDWFAGIGQTTSSADESIAPAEIEPAFASWMSAFTDEETTTEEPATEVDNFLADFVDPDAARIGAQRPMVAQAENMVDNMEESESRSETDSFSFDFDFDFDKPPAWMRKAGGEDNAPSFKPKWMRGQGE